MQCIMYICQLSISHFNYTIQAYNAMITIYTWFQQQGKYLAYLNW